jgi:YVTN family beta-propeller protein
MKRFLLLIYMCPLYTFSQQATFRAHSHNDYKQANPFHHAFARGFSSIEADVFLVKGRLLVAHEIGDTKENRSLESMYLEPLSKELKKRRGKANDPSAPSFQLLIDVKSEAMTTLDAIVDLLKKFPDLTSRKEIRFTISGNRPPDDRYPAYPAFIFFDGRPGSNYTPEALKKVALISDSYANYLLPGTRTPDSERAKKVVDAAHALQKPFRFWGNPDNEQTWELLAEIGTDYINTDDIDGLSAFMEKAKTNRIDKKIETAVLHDSLSLMPYNRMVRSAGNVVRFGDPALENHALDVTPIAGTSLVAIADRYGILVSDLNGRILDRFSFAGSKEFKGLTGTYSGIRSFSHKGKTHIIWPAAGGSNAWLMHAEWNGRIENTAGTKFEKVMPASNAIPNELFVETGKETTIYLILNGNEELLKLSWPEKRILWRSSTGVAPYGVTMAGNKLYISNWGGPRATDSSRERAGVPWGQAYTDPVTGATAQGSVMVFDPSNGKLLKEIRTGLHPNVIIRSRDEKQVYVCNGNSDDITVINTRTDQVAETIPVGMFAQEYKKIGSSPNGISIDNNTARLYVSNGMDNALAVVQLGKRSATNGTGSSRILGYIPTEAYPAGSTLIRDTIVVANLESEGANVINPARSARSIHAQYGSFSIIPVPDSRSLAALTSQVYANALQHRISSSMLPPRMNMSAVPVPERIGEPSVFKHVVYIIKENKTYDQVFGDMKEGRGDSSLCIFGNKITPNTHALASQYGWMDNYYASGKSSAEGHQWSNAAIVSDYVEKNVRAWFRSYPHRQEDAMVYNSTGYIWNHAMDHGKKVRIYGEACRTVYDNRLKWTDLYKLYKAGMEPVWNNTTTIERIRPVISPLFPDNDNLVFSDQQRADIFIREWEAYEKGDSLPHLLIVSLPNDHAAGLSPDFPTPNAMVADNDLALGRIVEKITNSRYFDSTVIFITQDDSQSGWDHISAYRTVGLVISPYARNGVITSNYNQTSMVRTMEQILGLPPMNVIDATAAPMFGCFSSNRNNKPYHCLPSNVPLDQMNKPLSALKGKERRMALKSQNELFNEVDGGQDDEMNRIIWFYARGQEPYPSDMGKR